MQLQERHVASTACNLSALKCFHFAGQATLRVQVLYEDLCAQHLRAYCICACACALSLYVGDDHFGLVADAAPQTDFMIASKVNEQLYKQ